jgi:hypothetical protein
MKRMAPKHASLPIVDPIRALEPLYYTVMRRARGGYYVFVTAAEGSDEPVKEADTSIRAAAFKVLPK